MISQTPPINKHVPWEAAKPSVIGAKDLSKPVRPKTWIPGPEEAVKTSKAATRHWELGKKQDAKGLQLIVLLGEASWKKMQELELFRTNQAPF